MSEHLWKLYQNTYFRWPANALNCSRFSIISSRNPLGNIHDEETNQRLHQTLEDYLQHRDVSFAEIIAGNENFTFLEPSFAIKNTFEEANVLARNLTQNAFFWVEAGQLKLVPAILNQMSEVNLGIFSARLVTN